MFQKNNSHFQKNLFGMEPQLSKVKLKKLQQSKEMYFYQEFFSKIAEEDFLPLFSASASRPNAPVNALVAACILKEHCGWTIRELLDRIDFDLLTRTALGLSNWAETPFCNATYFNFQNRLLQHFLETGENLLERVFDKMTSQQLAALKLKTDIQRMDSFQALSNIRSYSRIQLFIEMLLRLYRVLDEQEQLRFQEILAPYLKRSSGKYVYELKGAEIIPELEKLAAAYQVLYTALKDTHAQQEVFRTFARVYTEHFTVVSAKMQMRKAEEIPSGSLQSPDDPDATFRSKNGESYKGQVVNICETAHPENALNLITDVVVAANNTDDRTLLQERVDVLLSKTPDLKEIHTDGAYGRAVNDENMAEHHINHVQTAVRGRAPQVEIKIVETALTKYLVSCPQQQVWSEKTRTREKALFDAVRCATCPQATNCQTIEMNAQRVFYFDQKMARRSQRACAIETLPPERQRLRPNVEATVKEFTTSYNHKGKLRVRGWFKTMLFAFFKSWAINFGRIYRYLRDNPAQPLSFRKNGIRLAVFCRITDSWGAFCLSRWITLLNFQRTAVVATKISYCQTVAF
jgi:hypothetical protein